MTRRTVRRRYAIIGALAEHGPMPGFDLCQTLRRSSGTIYPDLAALESEGRVIGEWAEVDGFGPRRRLYRLATDDERIQRRRIRRQVDQEIADRVAARSRPRRPWRLVPAERP